MRNVRLPKIASDFLLQKAVWLVLRQTLNFEEANSVKASVIEAVSEVIESAIESKGK